MNCVRLCLVVVFASIFSACVYGQCTQEELIEARTSAMSTVVSALFVPISSLEQLEALADASLYDDSVFFWAPTGEWAGKYNILEYLSLGNPSVNGGLLAVIPATNITYSFPTPDIVHWDYESDFFIKGDPGRTTFKNIFEFDPLDCSGFVRRFSIISLDTFNNAFNALLPGPYDACKIIMRDCTGENQQYDDMDDCFQFLTELPKVACAEGGGKGDSANCRWLHALLAGYLPDVHCPHTGKDSLPCTNDICDILINPPCEECQECKSCSKSGTNINFNFNGMIPGESCCS